MFFTRNDTDVLRRLKRRCRSSRASVFLEFALVAPLMVMLISAMIEFCSFWDAKVMANHAAWTVGRIVTVQDDVLIVNKLNKWASDGVKPSSEFGKKMAEIFKVNAIAKAANHFNSPAALATMCLMSTCGMGYFGGTPGQVFADFMNEMFVKPILEALAKIGETITSGAGKITSWIKDIGGKAEGIGISFLKPLTDALATLIDTVVKKILEAVLKPVEKFINEKVKGFIEQAKQWINKLFGIGGGDAAHMIARRRGRQFYGAAVRLAKTEDVLKIEDLANDSDYSFKGTDAKERIAFPQVVGKSASLVKDDRKVRGWTGWPPDDSVKFALRKVKVAWPFSTGWMFPVLSSSRSDSAGTLRAVGHAMVIPPCPLTNEMFVVDVCTNLVDHKFETNQVSSLSQIADRCQKFLKLHSFALDYRIKIETLTDGTGSASNNTSTTYHLLNPIAENLDFAPIKPNTYYDIPKMLADADYVKTYENVVGTKDMKRSAGDITAKLGADVIHPKDYFRWMNKDRRRYHLLDNDNLDAILRRMTGGDHQLIGSRNWGMEAYGDVYWEYRTERDDAWKNHKSTMEKIAKDGGLNMWGYISYFYGDAAIQDEVKLVTGESNVVQKAEQLIAHLKDKNAVELRKIAAQGVSPGVTVDPVTGEVRGQGLPSGVDPTKPEEVARHCAKKLEEYKKAVNAAYEKVDAQLDALNELVKAHKGNANGMFDWRFGTMLSPLRKYLYTAVSGDHMYINSGHQGDWRYDLDHRPGSGPGLCRYCRVRQDIFDAKDQNDLVNDSRRGQKAMLAEIDKIADGIKKALELEDKYLEVIRNGLSGGGGGGGSVDPGGDVPERPGEDEPEPPQEQRQTKKHEDGWKD